MEDKKINIYLHRDVIFIEIKDEKKKCKKYLNLLLKYMRLMSGYITSEINEIKDYSFSNNVIKSKTILSAKIEYDFLSEKIYYEMKKLIEELS